MSTTEVTYLEEDEQVIHSIKSTNDEETLELGNTDEVISEEINLAEVSEEVPAIEEVSTFNEFTGQPN